MDKKVVNLKLNRGLTSSCSRSGHIRTVAYLTWITELPGKVRIIGIVACGMCCVGDGSMISVNAVSWNIEKGIATR